MSQAAASLAVERGWLPVLALAGARDPARAIPLLREVGRLSGLAIAHTELDTPTRALLTRASESLHAFNLRRMYELLPEQDGAFHQLSLSAGFSGKRYVIGRQKHKRDEIGPGGHRQRLGDASLVLRAAPVPTADDDTNYLLQARAGIVVGPIDWAMVVDAAQQFVQLLGDGPAPARPHARSRQNVLTHNPKLGPEDVDQVATLWEAFPHLADLLRTLGGIDDVVDPSKSAAPGVARMRVMLHLDPERMQARFPELSEYVADLDKLFEAELRWLDAQNRTIALLHLNSQRLSAQLELYQTRGLLLPSRQERVIADQPIEAGLGSFPYSVRAGINFRALGIGVQLRDVRVHFEHVRSARGMVLRGHMKHLPSARVSGAALGFVPTGLIDVLIPGNIQGLVDKSLAAACRGNGGRGAELLARFDRRAGGEATLDVELAFEAIDNFLVKLGVGHFNQHLMPDDDVREELSRLLSEAHQAFGADLERYASAHAPSSP